MKRIPLATQFYVLPGAPQDNEDLLNMYVEATPEQGRGTAIVRPTAGLQVGTVFGTIGTGPFLAMDGTLAGQVYCVSGTHAYRLTFGATAVIQDLGYIGEVPAPYSPSNDPKIVTIAIGVLGAVICNPPNAYYCAHTDAAVAQINNPNFPGADSVAYLDGRFVFNFGAQVFCSGLLDPTSFDALDFFYAGDTPNVITRLIVLEDDIWAMGFLNIEIIYDAGTANFPFAPRPGGNIRQGCFSPATVAIADNKLHWLGSDGKVYQSSGYRAVRISTPALEYWMRDHNDYHRVEALAYASGGRWYYVLTFFGAGNDNDPRSYCYDLLSKRWHRRASSADGTGVYQPSRACQQGPIALLGDRASGVAFLDVANLAGDQGVASLRRVDLPPLWADTRREFMSRLEIEYEAPPGVVPQIAMSYSDDGGLTWSTPRQGTPSASNRIFWTRLGNYRHRAIRFEFQEALTLYGVDADIVGGAA